MMLTGVAYGLLGIKSRELHNFMSVAYLAVLAVTVLVIYVMDPPVSNAVQGAYFVAAIGTGLILGGIATVFSDLTDGLGCALGGFCISMWFLTLTEGGLIQSKGGKAGFILAFTCIAFVFSFAHYTREFALLGCISFAGATITVLGIDCFSRAGYKEFWIYIWSEQDIALVIWADSANSDTTDLNTDEFPLGTNTYPINRGMRVETAAIVLLFLLGLVTQSKLYQKIKQHREERDAEAAQDAETREKRESAIGKRVMDTVSRDRARWDSLYDRENGASTTDEDGMKRAYASLSDRHISSEDMEMSDLGSDREIHESGIGASKPASRLGVTITTVEAHDEDEIRPIGARKDIAGFMMREQSPEQIPQDLETMERPLSAAEAAFANSSNNPSPRVSVQQPVVASPPVVPLPFRVPVGSEEEPKKAATNVGSRIESLSRRLSGKRTSVASSMKRQSFQSLPDAGPSQEDLIVRHIEDDRASSIAATIDLLDIDDLSPDALPEPRSPLDQNFASQQQPVLEYTAEGLPQESVSTSGVERMTEATEQSGHLRPIDHLRPDVTAFRKSVAESFRLSMLSDGDEERLKPEEDVEEELKPNDSVSRPVSLQSALPERRNSLKSAVTKSEVSHAETLETLKNNVPELPKNLMIYRTNEWAKHAAEADAPSVEEIERPESPGVQVQHEKPQQNPRKPLPVEQPTNVLAESPLNTAGPPVSAEPMLNEEASSTPTSAPGSRRQSSANLPQATQAAPEQLYTSRNSSAPNIIRGASFQARNPLRDSRNSSTPVLSTIPSDGPSDGAALGHRRQGTDVLTPLPSDTLLDKRSSKLRARLSGASLGGGGSSVPTYAFTSTPDLRAADPVALPVTPDDSASVRYAAATAAGDPAEPDPDDIPLAARKARLPSRNSSADSVAGAWPAPLHVAARDSAMGAGAGDAAAGPRIQRTLSNFDAAKRDSNAQQWRASLSREQGRGRAAAADEGRRAVMIESKRRSEALRQFAQMEKRSRDDAFDRSMRSGAMLSRHNELLRRMEASVPKDG